jgi:nucleoside-diphosphate-sugar epimerase
MRVLIIGCGYVGLPLGAALRRLGHEVFGLRRSAPEPLQAAGLIPLIADLTRPESLAPLRRHYDWVVNCAASGGGSAEDYRRLYLEGNRHLIAWLASAPPQKFIYTSSTSVYGQNDGSVVTESSPVQPATPTAEVLVATEALLLAAARNQFPAAILRVAGIYGPGRGHAFQQFLRGEARLEGDGSRYLNMIHRDDVIGVILAALASARPGEIYNAVDNEPATQAEFFGWLAAEMQRPLPPRVDAMPEAARKRGLTNKRVSNAKLRAEWRHSFKFPHFRAGYAAEIARLATPLPPDRATLF